MRHDSIIEAPNPLAAFLGRARGGSLLALDVEGDGFFRYRSRLCAVQLATLDELCVVDTLSFDARSALQALTTEGSPIKVIHDASYDARLLSENGVVLDRIFDTSVAARFLGEPATGLASLLQAHLGISLPKGMQNADWGLRPLNETAIAYLENDVRYLLQLASLLQERLQEAKIAEEVEVECRYLLDRAHTDERDPRSPWMRIKGADALSPIELSILRELSLVREELAREADVPPFKVTGNLTLVQIAKQKPKTSEEMGRIESLGRGRGRRAIARLTEACRHGEEAAHVPEKELLIWRPPAPPQTERDAKKKLQKSLTAWRNQEAKKRGVDAQVVLPGHCIKDLVARPPTTLEEVSALRGFGDCRASRYAKAILELMK